jgi:hypothetical protein
MVTRERCIIYYWIPGLIIVLLRRCREGDAKGDSPRESQRGEAPVVNPQGESPRENAEGNSPSENQ